MPITKRFGRCLPGVLLGLLMLNACDEPRKHAPTNPSPDRKDAANGSGFDTPAAGASDAPNASLDAHDSSSSEQLSETDAPTLDGHALDADQIDLPMTPSCGNGLIETGEQCDPPGTCPTACPKRGCTKFILEGNAATCTSRCAEAGLETACVSGDGCCPAACNATNDSECAIKCDNGAKEAGETCDPLASCPTICAPQGCQLRKLVNAGSCTAECVNDRQQTVCASGDGCCPSACDSTKDGDCAIKCGNGVLEAGETCDPVAQCNQRQGACKSDRDTVRSPGGDPSRCTFTCAETKRACGPADGQCPADCGVASSDPDCKRADGAACDQNAQCQNGFCVDRVCCSSRCDGQCEGCSNAVTGKTNGTCAPVRAGMDPRSDCSDAGKETCGNDGTCDGARGCRKYAVNTVCGAATCSSDRKSEISERKCDGSGTCFLPSSTACGAGEACEGSRCVSTCGQMDQPCCEMQTCKDGLTCLTLTDRIRCGRCGGLGQICCSGPTGPPCSEGDCFGYPNGAVCENCGKRGQRCCKPNDSCMEGTCMGVTVRQCF